MKRFFIPTSCLIAAALLAGFLSFQTAIIVGIGAAVGVAAAYILNKSKVFGAIGGVILALFAFALLVPSISGPPRCEFGDPFDLPTLTHPAGYVYVIQDTEFSKRYKIGRTNSPGRRLNEIRNILPGSSDIVAIIDTQDAPTLESQLHQRYVENRKRGEWFDLNDAEVREICRI